MIVLGGKFSFLLDGMSPGLLFTNAGLDSSGLNELKHWETFDLSVKEINHGLIWKHLPKSQQGS